MKKLEVIFYLFLISFNLFISSVNLISIQQLLILKNLSNTVKKELTLNFEQVIAASAKDKFHDFL